VHQQSIDDESMTVLKVDDYLIRTYVNGKGETVSLYIGYFKAQKEGKRIHSPRQCLPGAGWTPLEVSTLKLSLTGHNSPKVSVNHYLMAKGDQKQLYLFWYQGRGRIYANEYLNKVYLVWDTITKHRTDGALVRVNMPVTRNPDATLRSLLAFTNNFMPTLAKYIPK
jgi:EpsI family protein